MGKRDQASNRPDPGTGNHGQNRLHSKEDFVRFCHLLYASDLVCGAGGNLSMRLGRDVLVTPTGCSLRDVTAENAVTVTMEGDVVAGETPTKDMDVHLGILRSRPEINTVCHLHGAHIIAATTLLEPGPESLPPLTPGFVYFAYPLAMIPFMVPGSEDCARAVNMHFAGSETRALMMQNHGLITIGANFQIALNIAEEINEAARIWVLSRGKATSIPPDDLEKIKGL